MKSKDVKIPGRYHAKVNNKTTIVSLTGQEGKGYSAINETTGRKIYFRSARRLLKPV